MHLTVCSGMVVGFLSNFCPIWRSIIVDMQQNAYGGRRAFKAIVAVH